MVLQALPTQYTQTHTRTHTYAHAYSHICIHTLTRILKSRTHKPFMHYTTNHIHTHSHTHVHTHKPHAHTRSHRQRRACALSGLSTHTHTDTNLHSEELPTPSHLWDHLLSCTHNEASILVPSHQIPYESVSSF